MLTLVSHWRPTPTVMSAPEKILCIRSFKLIVGHSSYALSACKSPR
jgi:hypothetical protein